MSNLSLGEKIRQLREAKDDSLREFARKIEISAPFLSDIELGRRFPSEEILEKIARALGYPVADLRTHDVRQPADDVKKLINDNPALGFAFRTLMNRVKAGELNHADIVQMISKKDPKK